MNQSLLTQKHTHLFKILDFDHDGLLQESDFLSVGENISIFRCVEPGSDIEELISKRATDLWETIKHYLETENLTMCNLENWLKFLNRFTEQVSPRAFDVLTQKTVRDIFYIYDKNMDNYLSKQEYLCFFVSLRVGIKQADQCFKALDLNNDMLISRDELYLAIKEFFLSEDPKSPGNLLFGDSHEYQFGSRTSYLYA